LTLESHDSLKEYTMKSFHFILAGILMVFASTALSQISVNVNIGAPPLWGPAGYSEVRYYYLPDLETYYDVQTSMFIYYGGGRWVHRPSLPPRYRNYDLYGGYKVVLSDYHGDAPYIYFKEHKGKYYRGYRGEPQHTIGERPGRGRPSPGYSNQRGHENKGVGRNEGNKKGQGRGSHGGKNKMK
jgi:hypothetical protein